MDVAHRNSKIKMKLSEQEISEIKEALEMLVDLSTTLPPKEVFEQVLSEGGGIQIGSTYYGDDDATYFFYLNYLLKKFDVEYDIFQRFLNG